MASHQRPVSQAHCSANLNKLKEISMKRTWMWCLVGLLLVVSAAWSQDSQTEKAVAALEQQWLQSQKTNNPDLVARCWPTSS